MGGGGAAPAMKMSDVFILTGLTLMLGGLFMHAWVTPIDHDAGDTPYRNGASMMKGDAFDLRIQVDNQTTVRIVLTDENNAILNVETVVLAAGEEHHEVITTETLATTLTKLTPKMSVQPSKLTLNEST